MRVSVFAMANEAAEAGMEPTPEMLEAFQAMDAFTEELVKAGVFVAAAGLKPSAEGRTALPRQSTYFGFSQQVSTNQRSMILAQATT